MSQTFRVTSDAELLAARAAAIAGDVIAIADGTYTETPIPRNAGVRVIGNDSHRERVVVRGGDVNASDVSIQSLVVSHLGSTLAAVSKGAPARRARFSNVIFERGSNCDGTDTVVYDRCVIGVLDYLASLEINATPAFRNFNTQLLNCTLNLSADVSVNGSKCMALACDAGGVNFVDNFVASGNVINMIRKGTPASPQGPNGAGAGLTLYGGRYGAWIGNTIIARDITGRTPPYETGMLTLRNGSSFNTFQRNIWDQGDGWRITWSSGNNKLNESNRWMFEHFISTSRVGGAMQAQAGLHDELFLQCDWSKFSGTIPFDLPTSCYGLVGFNHCLGLSAASRANLHAAAGGRVAFTD